MPFAKLRLSDLNPWSLAGLLYLGSGISLGIVTILRRKAEHSEATSRLERRVRWTRESVTSRLGVTEFHWNDCRQTMERVQRRLVAILAADVAGYSRLMSEDEEGTLAALKAHRHELIDRKIAEHDGRIVKLTGDGMLAEFPSVVNAVACAVEMQEGMNGRNAAVPPGRRISFRIGINLGDVIVEGDDLYGDGVNVAARLESIAEPGGVAVSAAVMDNVGNRLKVAFTDRGEQQLKNIDRLVRVYSVAAGEVSDPAGDQPIAPTKADRLSIAVLPFTNMSGDREQQYFSDGITEDIITELSRFRQLHVLARNSSFQYRGRDVDMVRAGRELGVQYLVEGSVRRLGQRIRITAQLIEAANGNHLWAERFDRDQEDIFLVQDQVVRTIVATLVGRMQAAGAERAKRKPPASLAAYEYVLRADALPFHDRAAREEARILCEKAIEVDPTYARAYAFQSFLAWGEWSDDKTGSDSALDKALALAKKAVALDENDSNGQIALGETYLLRRAFDIAEYHYLAAHDLNPNRPSVMAGLGRLYGYLGEPEKGMEFIKAVRTLDPYFNPPWYWETLGTICLIAHQYEEAIAAFKRSPILPGWVHAYIAACYALLEKREEAELHAAEALRLTPDFSLMREAAKEPFKHAANRQHLIDGLRKAGLPE
jgi:adenylate cyclase